MWIKYVSNLSDINPSSLALIFECYNICPCELLNVSI